MDGEMTEREPAVSEQMPLEQMLSRIEEIKQELKKLEEAASIQKESTSIFGRLNPFKGGKRTKNKRKQSKRKSKSK